MLGHVILEFNILEVHGPSTLVTLFYIIIAQNESLLITQFNLYYNFFLEE